MKNLRNKLNEEVKLVGNRIKPEIRESFKSCQMSNYGLGDFLTQKITYGKVGAVAGITTGVALGYWSASCEGDTALGSVIMTAFNPLTYLTAGILGTVGFVAGISADIERRLRR